MTKLVLREKKYEFEKENGIFFIVSVPFILLVIGYLLGLIPKETLMVADGVLLYQFARVVFEWLQLPEEVKKEVE